MTRFSKLKLLMPWMNCPNSHNGKAQKLKYNVILAQYIVLVNGNETIYGILGEAGTIRLRIETDQNNIKENRRKNKIAQIVRDDV